MDFNFETTSHPGSLFHFSSFKNFAIFAISWFRKSARKPYRMSHLLTSTIMGFPYFLRYAIHFASQLKTYSLQWFINRNKNCRLRCVLGCSAQHMSTSKFPQFNLRIHSMSSILLWSFLSDLLIVSHISYNYRSSTYSQINLRWDLDR